MGECSSIEKTNLTYHQKNREVILNRAKDYYENNDKNNDKYDNK